VRLTDHDQLCMFYSLMRASLGVPSRSATRRDDALDILMLTTNRGLLVNKALVLHLPQLISSPYMTPRLRMDISMSGIAECLAKRGSEARRDKTPE